MMTRNCATSQFIDMLHRHCDCVYYQSWHRTTPTRPGKDVLPGVAPDVAISSPLVAQPVPVPSQNSTKLPSARLAEQNALANVTTELSQKRGLPFDEESKLLYGLVYSLRSMVRKLSPKECAFHPT